MAAAETPNLPEAADEAQVGRRVVLRGISAMGLAAFAAAPLAACGGGDDDPAAVAPEATPEATLESTPSATATTTPKAGKTPKAEATTQATKSAEASPKATPKPEKPAATPKPAAGGAKLVKDGNTPIASTADVPVNSGALFEADGYVVTQPKAGQFIGFDSLCTHEGCPIDVFDTPGKMSCSCHSSDFTLTDGKPTAGPARKPIPKKPIIVEGGQIYKAKPA